MKQTKNKKRKQEFYMRHKVETVKSPNRYGPIFERHSMLASVKFHLDGPTKWILSRISSVRKLDFPLNPRIICVLQNFDEE